MSNIIHINVITYTMHITSTNDGKLLVFRFSFGTIAIFNKRTPRIRKRGDKQKGKEN
jgi:hypothetical protein